MDGLVLSKVVSDFGIQVVEADHFNVRSSDSSVVHTRNILCEMVDFLILVDENLRHLEEYQHSILVLVPEDLVPEVAV